MLRHFRKYFLKDVPDRNRFRKHDKPTQETFGKLFESVAFIKEKEDRAKLTDQGLVRLVNNDDARNYLSPDPNCSYAVQPPQLPDVAAGQQSGNIPASMPRFTVDVEKNTTKHPLRATWFVRLRTEFLTWLANRLVPEGGFEGDVLIKDSNDPFAVSWGKPNNCKVRVFNVSAAGLDEEYDTLGTIGDGYDQGSNFIAGGRRGRLDLWDRNCFFWFLTGNPDPSPYDDDEVSTFREINHKGAADGCILRLKIFHMKNDMGADLPNVLFREQDAFQGNIMLGEFGLYDGGFRELEAYNGDTLSFIRQNNRWYLFDHESPRIGTATDVVLSRSQTYQGSSVYFGPTSSGVGSEKTWLTLAKVIPGTTPSIPKIDFVGSLYNRTPRKVTGELNILIDGVKIIEQEFSVAPSYYLPVTSTWLGGIDARNTDTTARILEVAAGEQLNIEVKVKLDVDLLPVVTPNSSPDLYFGLTRGVLTIS